MPCSHGELGTLSSALSDDTSSVHDNEEAKGANTQSRTAGVGRVRARENFGRRERGRLSMRRWVAVMTRKGASPDTLRSPIVQLGAYPIMQGKRQRPLTVGCARGGWDEMVSSLSLESSSSKENVSIMTQDAGRFAIFRGIGVIYVGNWIQALEGHMSSVSLAPQLCTSTPNRRNSPS